MATFGDRLLVFIKTDIGTQQKFANDLGILRTTVSRYVRNRTSPTIEFLYKLKKQYPSLNLNWLTTGEGDMYKSEAAVTTDISDVMGSLILIHKTNNTLLELHDTLDNLLLDAMLKNVYNDMGKGAGFWKKVFDGNRKQIVALKLLEKVFKKSIKGSSDTKITENNAKKALLALIRNYNLSISDEIKYLIVNKEKIEFEEYVKDELTDMDAYFILHHMPDLLNIISKHIERQRKSHMLLAQKE